MRDNSLHPCIESFIIRESDGFIAHEQYGDSMWDGTIQGEWDYLKRLVDEAEASVDPWDRKTNDEHDCAVWFNRNPFEISPDAIIEEPSQKEIKSSPQLVNASLDDALRYGGDIAREVIGNAPLQHDRKYIVVDTKIHMLMKGMSPAIPGWHTDGAPRDAKSSPIGSGPPDILAQEHLRPPRYHILVTSGGNSLTEFLDVPVRLHIPRPTGPSLYADITRAVNNDMEGVRYEDLISVLKPCHIGKFDWWNLHRGVPSLDKGWRYLIRICETDYLEPWTNLRDIFRTQIQVYVPETFGW